MTGGFPHKGSVMRSFDVLFVASMDKWSNKQIVVDLRRHGAHLTSLEGTVIVMTSSNGDIFRVTGPLCVESTGHWWIPLHKGQWCGPLVFSFMCAWTTGLANNRDAGGLRRHRPHYDITVLMRCKTVNPPQAALGQILTESISSRYMVVTWLNGVFFDSWN